MELAKLLDDPALLEVLADIEHERWSGWETYRADCLAKPANSQYEPYEIRWRRQRSTVYADLTEAEKESDREEARKGLAAIRAFLLATSKEPV